jgi:hypothetical protein
VQARKAKTRQVRSGVFNFFCVSQKDLSPSFRASIALSPRELREWYKEIFIDRVTWLTVSTNHTSEFFSPPDSSLAFFLDNQDVPCSNFDVRSLVYESTPQYIVLIGLSGYY